MTLTDEKLRQKLVITSQNKNTFYFKLQTLSPRQLTVYTIKINSFGRSAVSVVKLKCIFE